MGKSLATTSLPRHARVCTADDPMRGRQWCSAQAFACAATSATWSPTAMLASTRWSPHVGPRLFTSSGRVAPATKGEPGGSMQLFADLDYMHLIDGESGRVL